MGPLPSWLDAEFSSEPGKEPRAVLLTSVLEFKCSPGLLVEGTELGGLQDIAIVGDYDPGNDVPYCPGNKRRGAATPIWSEVYPGIEARLGAGLTLQRYVGVANMDGQGVSAQPGSWIVADRTASSGHERRGFYPTLNAGMQLTETIASGNHTDGYIADHTATLDLIGVSAVGNSENGINAAMRAQVSAQDVYSALNGYHGFAAIGGGQLWIGNIDGPTSSDAFANAWHGVYVQVGGVVSAQKLKLEDNIREGIRVEHAGVWAADATVDNRDGTKFDSGATLLSPLSRNDILQERRSFANRALGARTPRAAASPFSLTHVKIDPVSPFADLASLHEFFNGTGEYSIGGRRIVLGPDEFVAVELEPGVHGYAGGPIVISHPDAQRVRIRGAVRSLKIDFSMNPWVECGPSCTEVKLQMKADPELDVGDFLAIYSTLGGSSAGPYDHWRHRGVWQVSQIDVNGEAKRIKVRNLSGPPSEFSMHLDGGESGLHAKALDTVLYFPAVSGTDSAGVVVDGTSLGLLEDVVIVGGDFVLDDAGGTRTTTISQVGTVDHAHCNALGYDTEPLLSIKSGLKAQNCGHLQVNMVGVTGFAGAGVTVAQNASLVGKDDATAWGAGYVLSSANERGFVAKQDAALRAKGSVASGSLKDGFYAADRAVVTAALSVAAGNQEDGFEIRDGAHLDASRSVAIDNGQSGYRILTASIAAATAETDPPASFPDGSHTFAGYNQHYGIVLSTLSFGAIDRAWIFGHSGSNRAGLHVSAYSVARASRLHIEGNTWGIKAMSASVVSAPESTCANNGSAQYVDSSSVPPAEIYGGCL